MLTKGLTRLAYTVGAAAGALLGVERFRQRQGGQRGVSPGRSPGDALSFRCLKKCSSASRGTAANGGAEGIDTDLNICQGFLREEETPKQAQPRVLMGSSGFSLFNSHASPKTQHGIMVRSRSTSLPDTLIIAEK